jgi:hypothetical protein
MNRSLVLNSDALDNLFSGQKQVQRGRGGNDDVDALLRELGGPNPTYPFEQHKNEPPLNAESTSDGTLSAVLDQLANKNNKNDEYNRNYKLNEQYNQLKNNNNNQLTSATSVDDPKMMENNSSDIVYHVIFDSDFGMRNKLHQHNSAVFGKLRNAVENDKVPVLFDFTEAVSVAKRLIDQTVRLGTIGDKKFPVFGAIVLGLKLHNVSVKTSSVDSGTGKRDYKLLNVENNGLTTYDIHDNKRGVVSRNALEHAVLMNAAYVKKLDTSANVGFYLHNINPKLSADDVKLLKQLYDADGQQVFYNANQTGGDNDDQYKLAYINEKKRYLQLKKVYGNVRQNQSGGNNDEQYKTQYLQEKARYLELKEIAKKRGLINN